ncbi:MAG TPA: tetratricopeptide repeat protein [Acetobacteraceae bacterium]|nr:tetratricopeptide repeat protein [Acetobacteraceae bacterium]
MVDIFDEVDEELRAERAQQLLKRYAGVIVAVALLIVAAAAGWQGWHWYQARRDQAAAAQYLIAMNLANAPAAGSSAATSSAAIVEFDRVVATAPEGYRTLARLRAAALKADAGDRQGAAALWDQVAADGSADPLLRDLASLLWASHLIDSADPSLLQDRLKALTAPDNPWHALANEQLALLDMRLGKTDQAKTMLRSLAQDTTAPNGVRGRAESLLNRLGG